jgi:DNA gyrase subunit A
MQLFDQWGVGMHFRNSDELLDASVVSDHGFIFVVTEGGYAKRTSVNQYRLQNRGGLGIKVAKLNDERGVLVGSLIVEEADEVLVVLTSGKVVRSDVAEVPAKGRDTMGVVFAKLAETDRIIALAKNTERNLVSHDGNDESATERELADE